MEMSTICGYSIALFTLAGVIGALADARFVSLEVNSYMLLQAPANGAPACAGRTVGVRSVVAMPTL
ncbi:hypothetical protein SCP_0311920 [Sparassis crispa]|uniref:Uncharacterized protein n=1 Tax=Sparassis crispa TaxID=139825 RepID=A0A401GH86_9APHY|nr:hypothetical protein SCP_0311920 [Sparassis crispa]GBE81463.1 hypothetical protein SCP_0311920 [Sparassis crispa]